MTEPTTTVVLPVDYANPLTISLEWGTGDLVPAENGEGYRVGRYSLQLRMGSTTVQFYGPHGDLVELVSRMSAAITQPGKAEPA